MTEPSYRLIAPATNQSFVFKWEAFNLATRWHFHPEIELIYIVKGKCSGVIGDGFQQFEEDDLVLLGSNFPHVLQEDREFAKAEPDCKPFGMIIQFTPDFLGSDFFFKPELREVNDLLVRANRGLHFNKAFVRELVPELLQMHKLPETRKLLSLLNILTALAENKAYEFITPKGYNFNPSHDEERMRSINQYVYEHFAGKINIRDVATVANMTETSFCRYFKSRTLKSFTRFLNEVRISYSCKLLGKTNYSVTEVCFESGFNELSYFTRCFKKITGFSPLHYRRLKKGL
ncbi:MAG: AraC family transcriptional regulator [Ferruginibacter sp.]